MSLDPEIPMFVCGTCLVTLTAFYLFKRKCLENNKLLLKFGAKQKQAAINAHRTHLKQHSSSQPTNSGAAHGNLQIQNTNLPTREERIPTDTTTEFQNTYRSIERRDAVLPSYREQRIQATEGGTVSQNAYRSVQNGYQLSQTTLAATERTQTVPEYQNAYRRGIQNSISPSNGEGCMRTTERGAVSQNVYRYPEQQASISPSNRIKRTQTVNSAMISQNTCINVEQGEQNLQTTIVQNAYRNGDRQNMIFPPNRDNRSQATEPAIAFQNREGTQTINQGQVFKKTRRIPEIQNTIVPSRLERTQTTEPTPIFPNVYRNLERQNTVLSFNREERIQSMNPEVVFTNLQRYQEIQTIILPLNKKNAQKTKPSGVEHTHTAPIFHNVYSNVENGHTIGATVFQNATRNQGTQNSISPSNREELSGFQNAYRNIEKQNALPTSSNSPSDGEKRTQTINPETIYQTSRNIEKQNKNKRTRINHDAVFENARQSNEEQAPILPTYEEHTRATKPVTVSENLFKNPETCNSFISRSADYMQITKLTTVQTVSNQETQRSNSPNHGEKQTQPTNPETIYQTSRNVEKQNKNIERTRTNHDTVTENTHQNDEEEAPVLPTYEEHIRATKPVTVSENIFRNPETCNSFISRSTDYTQTSKLTTVQTMSNEENTNVPSYEAHLQKTQNEEEIHQTKLTSVDNVCINLLPSNSTMKLATVAYRNPETQNTIVLSYDEHKQVKFENDISVKEDTQTTVQNACRTLERKETALSSGYRNQETLNDEHKQAENVISVKEEHIQTSVQAVCSNPEKNETVLSSDPTIATVFENTYRNQETQNTILLSYDEVKSENANNIKEDVVTLQTNIEPEQQPENIDVEVYFSAHNNKIDVKEDYNTFDNKSDHKFYQEFVKRLNSESITDDVKIPVTNFENDSSRPDECFNSVPEDEHMLLNDIDIKENFNSFDTFDQKLKPSDFNIDSVKDFYQKLASSVTSKRIENDYHIQTNNFESVSKISKSEVNDENCKVKCPICPEELLRSELKKHLTCHSGVKVGVKNYECKDCNQKFLHKAAFRNHRKIHFTRKHKCTFCKRSYRSIAFFELHLKTHTEEKKFDCSLCEKKFAHEKGLKLHLAFFHTREKKYECSVCARTFLFFYQFQRHEKSHENNFECSICNKKFACYNNLWQHNVIHKGVKKYECNICNKKFLHNSHLKQHLLTHTGVKDHVCTICDKEFALPGSLRKHIETHNKPKLRKKSIKSKSDTEADVDHSDSNTGQESEIYEDDLSSE